MDQINRVVLIIRSKQPFLAWLYEHDPGSEDFTLDSINGEPTAYLIAEVEPEDELEEYLKGKYHEIFELELEGWCTDEALWPADRDFEMFKEWFSVEYHSVICDLEPGPLEKEDG